MNRLEYVLPQDIEKRSLQIISEELETLKIVLPPENADVIMRCIHTSADFDYAGTLCFSKDAVAVARQLLQEGADIVTDTNMAKTGINKKAIEKFGCSVHCFMADDEIAAEAKERGLTRAYVSMEHASRLGKKIIFAVGNAPTALVALKELMDCKKFSPDFIIGVPVGFVNVVQAKELIMESSVPYIVNRGRKGGSNIAAAIVNALSYGIR